MRRRNSRLTETDEAQRREERTKFFNHFFFHSIFIIFAEKS